MYVYWSFYKFHPHKHYQRMFLASFWKYLKFGNLSPILYMPRKNWCHISTTKIPHQELTSWCCSGFAWFVNFLAYLSGNLIWHLFTFLERFIQLLIVCLRDSLIFHLLKSYHHLKQVFALSTPLISTHYKNFTFH